MARNTVEAWIPEEYGSDVIQRINQISVVEAVASRVPMSSDTRHVPRSAGMGVEVIDKGSAYGEDVSTNDDVLLSVKKFGKVIRLAEEDIDDSLVNILNVKMQDWGTSYAKILDNASLAVTAAPGTGVPFQSLYYLLSQTDATLGYTANSNITVAGSAGATYADYSNTVGLLESGDYYDAATTVAIAHPFFKKSLRGIVDGQQRPIFIEGLAGTPDTIFSVPIKWSLGAKTSPTATSAPGGRPIMAFVSTDLMQL
ncbi:phage major capsid protein, partial [Streptomyces sp. NPDC058296]|uniref:phage major capsid protein n=1 Tax=Streptomyces sp. NPDC058296 TaxID=3346432 RepID=UPI0036E7596A